MSDRLARLARLVRMDCLDWPLADVIWDWKEAYRKAGKKPGKGAGFGFAHSRAVTNGQSFTLVDFMHFNYSSRPKQLGYVFESDCVICGKRYRFSVPSYFKHVVRTCAEHRGQFRESKPAPEPVAKLDKKGPGSIQRVMLAEYESRDIIGRDTSREAIVDTLCNRGISNRSNLTRAWRTLQSRGLIS